MTAGAYSGRDRINSLICFLLSKNSHKFSRATELKFFSLHFQEASATGMFGR